MFKLVSQMDMTTVVSEWDALAPVRLNQIVSGADLTYNHILLPTILEMIPNERMLTVLDAGCGVGVLSARLNALHHRVTGVDPSQRSVELAKSNFGQGIHFVAESIEQHAAIFGERYDLIVANMVLMDVPSLDDFLASTAKLLAQRGQFVFSITHPAFFPIYIGYWNEPWFEYSKEMAINSPFHISTQPECPLWSTHVHRPLSMYARAFHRVGLAMTEIREPMPQPDVEALYPGPWRFPRYLIGSCRNFGG